MQTPILLGASFLMNSCPIWGLRVRAQNLGSFWWKMGHGWATRGIHVPCPQGRLPSLGRCPKTTWMVIVCQLLAYEMAFTPNSCLFWGLRAPNLANFLLKLKMGHGWATRGMHYHWDDFPFLGICAKPTWMVSICKLTAYEMAFTPSFRPFWGLTA